MSKPAYQLNELIIFDFVCPYYPKEDYAWIGIVPSSIPHGSEVINDQYQVNYKRLEGAISGRLSFPNPGIGQWSIRPVFVLYLL